MDFPTLPPILLEDGSSLLGVDQTLMATAPSMLAPTTPEVVPQVTPLTPSSPSNFIAPVSATVSDNLANQSDSLLSTPLLVNPEAANFSFSDQDTSWTGTPQVTQLDDLGEVLVVPGNPSERVNMVVQWTLREADFNNEVGFFLVDALGGVEGIAPGEPGFAEAALSSSSRQTLFNSGNQAGNWREFTVAGGSRLGFYVIQNSTSANWLENNRQNQGQSGLAFFSLKGANPDSFDHSQSSHLGRGIWRFNWEDLTGGGDQDFNDVVFNIAQAGIVLPGDKGQQVPLTVEAVSQDNTFPNEMGYYLVDTPDGEINGIKPGDQGYLDAALSGDRHQVIFASGKAFDSKTFNVPSGKYLGWYLVANGTTDQAIAKGENAPPVFFSFAAANEDGLNHVHAQQDSQTWAWEDFWGGGDRDFNDLVFRFSFGEPTGEPIQLPSLSIENTTVTEGNIGTEAANFTVRLSAPTNTTVTAQFTTTDGTAQAGTDYESSTGILTFAPGEVEKNIAVAVKGDTISEPTETFTVNLTGVTNAILIQGEGIGTIIDNDNSPNPPDNNPPVTDADKTITLPEDSQPIPLNINPPTDIDGDTLTVTITQLPDNSKGKITLADGTVINVGDEISINSLTSLLYTPLADVNGNGCNFIYTVSDGKGGSDSQTISFVINPIQNPGNNSPVTDADKTITLPEDSKPVPLNINPPTDIDGDTLTVSITQLPDNSKGKITLGNGTVINVGDEISINSLTSLLYTPLADVNGNGGNFVYTVSDGKGGSDSQTISFVITPENTSANNPPVTDADKTITLPEDSQPIPLNINPPTDIDGDTLRVSVTQLPDNSKGKITLADGTVINVGDEISINSLTSLLYRPLADVNGNGGNFVYTVSDGKGGNDSQTISFVLIAVSDNSILLREDNIFSKQYQQTISVPVDSSFLSFTYNDLNFDTTDSDSINDAFEVALVDAQGNSLIHTIQPNRDAFFNITENQPSAVASGVSIAGMTVKVNLTGVTPGDATLIFRLVNNDSDTQTSVRIRDIQLLAGDGTTAPPVTPNLKAAAINQIIDFSQLSDINSSLNAEYLRTSFNEDSKTLYADFVVRNQGEYVVDSPLVVAIKSISNPTVQVVGATGITPEGLPYYNLSDLVDSNTLDPDEITQSKTLAFLNPQEVQFTYKLVFLGKLNTAPNFISDPDIEALINKPYIYDADATDLEGDTLTYSLLTAPNGMTIESDTGKISWTPGTNTVGNYSISVQVNDGRGGIDQQDYTLSVIEPPPNRPPIITSIPIVDARVKQEYQYQAIATDPDSDTLTYSLVNAPNGMTIDANTGLIRWTATANQTGLQEVELKVNDEKGGVAEQKYQILVQQEARNTPPVIITDPVTKVYPISSSGNPQLFDLSKWTIVQYDLTVQDPDASWQIQPGNTVVEQKINADASILLSNVDVTNNRIEGTWRVGTSDDDDYIGFVFGYQDPQHFYVFDWKQADQNESSLGFAERGMSIKVVDANSSLTGTDLWPTNGNGQRVKQLFHNTVAWKDLTDYKFTIDFVPGQFTITVKEGNTIIDSVTINDNTYTSGKFGFYNYSQSNVLYSGFSQQALQAYNYLYDVNAIDPDQDKLTYSLIDKPTGMVINPDSGLITWATFSQSNPINVEVKVEDGRGGFDTQSFIIELADRNIDLTLADIHTEDLVIDGQLLTVSGQVSAQIKNQGLNNLNDRFKVVFFEDRNINQAYDVGIDTVLGEAKVNTPLQAGQSTTVTTNLSGFLSFINSPIWGFVDADKVITETNENNNLAFSSQDCIIQPSGQFNPIVEWNKNTFSVLPSSNQVMMTPAVIDLNGDKIPDIVFSTFTGSNYTTDGKLRAISGANGSELWTVTNSAYEVRGASGVAVGDIDNDGKPEILATGESGDALIAFEHDGTFKWRSPAVWGGINWGSASIADLNQDSTPEIIIGATVLDNQGRIIWQGNSVGGLGRGDNGPGPLSVVADLDLDGSPEVIAGRSAYRANGSLYWNASISDGFPAIGNFDSDPNPEIVVISNGQVYLLEHTGQVKWGGISIPGGGRGGAPTIADVDGDGQPEIGVAGANRYVVLETDGSIKWTSVTQDNSSNVTGSSVFDFNGDGNAEIVYGDEFYLRIYNGSDGKILYQLPKSSGTTYELPLIVDVDADGNAEIVAIANNYAFGSQTGIFVIGDLNDTWVSTRQIWNQHSYHITNINDDGSIPVKEQNSWQTHNTYRLNLQTNYSPLAAPDLTASYLHTEEVAGKTTIKARIGNGGSIFVASGVNVAFYKGDPKAGGVLLGTTKTTQKLEIGGFEDVSITVTGTSLQNIWVVADDDGTGKGQVNECNEENNRYSKVFVNGRGEIRGTKWEDINGNGIRDARNDTINLTVRGTDVIFLAGRNDVSIPPIGSNNSNFPLSRHSVVRIGFFQETFPEELVANTGDVFTFDSSGKIDFFNGTGQFFNSDGSNPDGSNLFKLAGVSGYQGPEGALVGVFLNNNNPANSNAPSTLNFTSSGLGLDFTALNPELGQVFFIGNGTTGTEQRQQFIAPKGATRLFLGIADGFDFDGQPGAYEDNDGAYQVRINRQTNEPGLAGVNVYLDANNNGVLDPNEPTQLTAADNPNTLEIDETGQYRFTNLTLGNYIVREVVPEGYKQTFPTNLSNRIITNTNVKVTGISDPWLAGMPDGSKASIEDTAPGQSPTIVRNLQLLPGSILTFEVTGGQVGNGPSPSLLSPNADGTNSVGTFQNHLTQFAQTDGGAENGISGLFAPINSLVGLFLDLGQPNSSAAPITLDFRNSGNVTGGINYSTLAPQLKQVFFIGDGLNAEGKRHQIIVPNGATRLFLGTMDGLGWWNNVGFYDVSVTESLSEPQPSFHTVTLTSGQIVEKINFGNIKTNEIKPNQSPSFVSTAPTTAQIDQLLRYDAKATDPDSDPLTFDLPLKPEGMAVEATTGILVWKPTLAQIGIHDVTLRVQDNKGGVSLQSFQVIVNNLNNAPIITSNPDLDTVINLPYQYHIQAQDADGDAIAFRLDTAPTGVTLDATTGILRWTPINSQVGQHTFTLIASDGKGGETRQTYNLNVLAFAPNHAPEITSTPRNSVALGTSYFYTLNISDPDGDLLTINLQTAPTGMTLNQQGLITWTPEANQLGNHTVKVEVNDGRGGFAEQEWAIAVVSQRSNNQAPQILSTPSLKANINQVYQYNLVGNDPDGDPIFWSLETRPQGMSLDVTKGTIRWQPKLDQIGLHEVVIQAIDTQGAISSQRFTLAVNGVNLPPNITSVPLTRTVTNQAYTYTVVAKDPENGILTYNLGRKPNGMTIDQTGKIQWTPTQIGNYDIDVLVADNQGATATQTYRLVVGTQAINQAPNITSTPLFVANVGSAYQYQIQASDPEGQSLTYQLIESPQGMTINANTGLVQWNTPITGNYKVVVAAFDSQGLGVTQGYTLTSKVNSLPVIRSTNPPTGAIPGVPYRYDIQATDPDGGILNYSLDAASQTKGITLDERGRLSWTPSTSQTGIHAITLTITDAAGGKVTQSFNLTVAPDTTAPKVIINRNKNFTNKGEAVSFQVSATDNVGIANLQLLINNTPVVIDSNGVATFTPTNPGVITAKALAFDAAGNKAEATTTVNVLDPTDTEAPSVSLDLSGIANFEITAPTPIKGTVNDTNLAYYALEVAPADGSAPFKEMFRGTTPVTNGVLGVLDPTLLPNDTYQVRLVAYDVNGKGNGVAELLDVSGDLKLGNFQLSFTDLEIPVGGIPITLTRTYNTLNSNNKDDFGFGWRMEFRDADVRTSLPKDELYQELGFRSVGFKEGDAVYITLPGGKRERFTFKLEPMKVMGIPLTALMGNRALFIPTFVADKGSTSTLSVETAGVVLTRGQNGQVVPFSGGSAFAHYHPQDWGNYYQLTTKEGIVYDIDATTGDINSITNRNSDKLTFTDAGITSSNGLKVTFGRDTQGRITTVTDPMGKQIKYEYDSKGDLIKVTDRENNTTQFKYNNAQPHYLDEIIDPLGRTGIKNEYDQNGRLTKVFNGEGKAVQLEYNPDNFVYSVKDPLGNSTTYESDARGNIITEIDANGGIIKRTYDDRNNLLSETNHEGEKLSYTYDTKGNKLSETDALGNVTRYNYNSNNDLLTTTDALGNVTTNTYDSRGNLLSITGLSNGTVTLAYNNNGLLTQLTTGEGTTKYEYDFRGNITKEINPLGQEITYTYDGNGNRLTETRKVTTTNGIRTLVTKTEYDSKGNIIKVTDAEGNISQTIYDAAGQKIKEIDALGRVTKYVYSEGGQLLETIYPDATPNNDSDNPRTRKEYDAANRVTADIDELGRPTQYQYDALGRLIYTIYPDLTPNDNTDNPRQETRYDKAGRVIAEVDERGNITRYIYDDAGRRTETILPDSTPNNDTDNPRILVTYDALGRQISQTDPLGRKTEFIYDNLGRSTGQIFADNTSISTTFDQAGRVIAKIDQEGNKTKYEYNALGQLTAVIDALNNRTEYGYNELGNLITQKDAKANITKYEYDGIGRRIATQLPLNQHSTTQYDQVGNIVSTTDFNGEIITFIYDERNRLIRKALPNNEQVVYTYTLTGQRATETDSNGTITYQYDSRDRLLSRLDPDGVKIEYTYDAAGNRTSVNIPSGKTSYTFDEQNRLKTVTDPNNGVTTYTYDLAGNLSKTTLPNGTIETREYDLLNRLLYLQNSNSNGVINSFRYTLDKVGNRLAVVEQDGRKVNYEYDDIYRLLEEEVIDGTTRRISYTYDPVSNRLTRNDSVEGNTTYEYDRNDRLLKEVTNGVTTTYTYDNNGNTLSKTTGTDKVNYQWNAENRLIGLDNNGDGVNDVTNKYDSDGIRISQTVNGDETRFLVDKNRDYAQVLEEYTPSKIIKASYVYGHDLISQLRNSQRSFYHVDGLGSTRALTDINGLVSDRYAYEAFGEIIKQLGNTKNLYLFAGEQRDPSLGLDYLRARYLDVSTGRFVSRDSFPGFDKDPITLHKYLYGNANPINGIDPSGKFTLLEVLNGINAFFLGYSIGTFIYEPTVDNALAVLFEILVSYIGGRIVLGGASGGVYAQKWYYETISYGGFWEYSLKAGRNINTINELALAIREGVLKISDVPVGIIVKDGTKYIVNTRTGQALERAGIPKYKWATSDISTNPELTKLLEAQLRRNKLSNGQGVSNPISKGLGIGF
ncbi:MAG: tandem-95 repeat protein [Microcystis sp. M41BS1]|nr:tandem-95 repeat protein [Microcystis sp. M41BS1]